MSRPPVTTAVDAVAQDLRSAILAGDPAPGEWLREAALAVHYQVARHTVRAALRQLAGERLVVVEAHRGARVAHLDGAELRALFELRTALEIEAVRLLQARRDGAWPADVQAAVADLNRRCAAEPVDCAAVDESHLALHHALVAAAGSPRITEAHAALSAEHRLALLQSRPALPVDRMAVLHRNLLHELTAEGPDALRRHLDDGRAMSDHPAPGDTM